MGLTRRQIKPMPQRQQHAIRQSLQRLIQTLLLPTFFTVILDTPQSSGLGNWIL